MEIIGRRYKIMDTLGAGGMGVVYRALDRLTGREVALKQVKYNAGALAETIAFDMSPTSLRSVMAHEFQTLAGLHHPHVIDVMDYGFDTRNHPFFTMTLLEKPRPLTAAGLGNSTAFKVQLLVEMLQALDYLHRRRMLHRDLKPDNALVTDTNHVRVLDFGLAILQEQIDPSDPSVSGTLSYIAPEMLQGGAPSPEGDLYAVGVMGYEMFAGHHPFDTSNVTTLIQQIMFEEPDMDELDATYDIVAVIERLLEKLPDDRYHSARDAIHDLLEASDTTIDLETEEIRESFLQAAPFIGREDEYNQLETALDMARDGTGSFWLVSGETGVGKTRLVDELRVGGLVRGMLVLRGQGVQGGGVPYQLWREPIRRLLLAQEVDATDAGVLKDIVPDIEQLLEITAGAVVQLQGPDYQQRLVTAIVNLFRGYNQPILLMLEDLQWAEESLSVLEALYNMYTELPIVIVGSYRHEEKPDLAETFAGARALNLKRLTDTAIARISVSMLGDAGSRPDVVKLLKDETAGNIYFMIEVIRALAEEAGDLSKIAYMDLPQTVAAGGIQDVLARRLKNVPSNVYDVLQIYALGGRDLDLNLLPHIVPGMPVDNFLAVCTNCAVLESLDEQWHFSHGRLRDAVEDTIDEDARRAMHRTLALAIEAAYPDAPEQAGMLAYQWQMANDHAKELHYQQVAGQYALRVSALSEAVTHFWRAVELLPADEDATRIDLLIKLSEAEKYMGNYDSATQHAEMALAVARKIDDGSRIAHAEQELSDVQFQLGNYDAAMAHGESSLTRYREQNDPQGTAKILSHMGQIHNQRGEFAQAAELGEESIRISEALSDDDVTSIKTLTRLGITYFSMGRWDDASRNFSRGLELSRKNNERRWVANALLNLGNVYSFSGDFDRAQEHYEECLDIVQKIGDLRVQASALNNLGYDNMLREAYETAQEFFEAALHVMKRIDNRYEVANTYANMGQVAEKQGNVEQARAYYLESIAGANSIDAKPIILESLAGIARIEPDDEAAITYVAVILSSGATPEEVREGVQEQKGQLEAKLSEDAFKEAWDAGEAREVDSVVRELLDGHTPGE